MTMMRVRAAGPGCDDISGPGGLPAPCQSRRRCRERPPDEEDDVSKKTTWNRREFMASGLAGVGLTATLPSLLTGCLGIHAVAAQDVRIPITMCHGITKRLTRERFEEYLRIAADLALNSSPRLRRYKERSENAD